MIDLDRMPPDERFHVRAAEAALAVFGGELSALTPIRVACLWRNTPYPTAYLVERDRGFQWSLTVLVQVAPHRFERATEHAMLGTQEEVLTVLSGLYGDNFTMEDRRMISPQGQNITRPMSHQRAEEAIAAADPVPSASMTFAERVELLEREAKRGAEARIEDMRRLQRLEQYVEEAFLQLGLPCPFDTGGGLGLRRIGS